MGGGGGRASASHEAVRVGAVLRAVRVYMVTHTPPCVEVGGRTPCTRVPKFSAGASRYSEAQSEQAEAKHRSG